MENNNTKDYLNKLQINQLDDMYASLLDSDGDKTLIEDLKQVIMEKVKGGEKAPSKAPVEAPVEAPSITPQPEEAPSIGNNKKNPFNV